VRADGDETVAEEGAPVARDDALAREEPAATADTDGGDDGVDDGAEMIRSEEEVSVGTRRRVSGKARLKKYVVTEHVQKVVPVQREEVRVEFEPADGEDAGQVPERER
jgi:stress response protein YsnF